jgi:hypothetical protein
MVFPYGLRFVCGRFFTNNVMGIWDPTLRMTTWFGGSGERSGDSKNIISQMNYFSKDCPGQVNISKALTNVISACL